MNKPAQCALAGLGFFLLPAAALAQFSQANQQVDAVLQQRQMAESNGKDFVTNSAPSLYPDEASDVGLQSILQPKPRHQLFQASADLEYFYTDNARYIRDNPQGSDVLVGTVQAALAPTPAALGAGFLASRVGFQQQWYNYGLADQGDFSTYESSSQSFATQQLGDLDFNAQTIFADETWRWRKWIFGGGLDYRRLMDSTDYRQFYSELVPRWSVKRLFSLTDDIGLALSYQGTYRITETSLTSPGLDSSSGNRTDQSLMIAGSWKLCDHLTLQPYYRFELSHYTGIHRDDWLSSCGVAVNCPLTRRISLRTFFGYDHLTTDGPGVESYQDLTAGAGINLNVAF